MTIKLKLFVGFLILIFIFILDFFVNQRLSHEVILNTAYINNSETIIRNSNVLHKHMIDMQSGFRGYLLTGQESFLEPYEDALKSIPPLLREQRSLLISQRQKARLDAISTLHQKWIDYANSLISTKKDTLPESGKKYVELFERKLKMEVGKKMNDEIRFLFIEFDNHEYAIRQTRRENLQHSIKNTGRVSLILTLFFIALCLISSASIINIITRRISKMVKQAQEISKGNFITMQDDHNDELSKLSVSLNSMSQTLNENFKELTKKNRELDQFAYVVSHDLKAPLRGIDNISTWIEEDYQKELSPGIKKNLDLIKGRTKRLENMINGLLDYARVDKTRKEVEQVDVMKLLNELVDELVPSNFVVSIAKMPILTTERLLIEQVFSNLLSNAVKYNDKEHGLISVRCVDQGEFYEFSLSDNGIGIQSEYFDKIFLIFQTLQERDAFESTGVGLAIVKKIIDDGKGTIHLKSEPGKGTTFIFTWLKRGQIKPEMKIKNQIQYF